LTIVRLCAGSGGQSPRRSGGSAFAASRRLERMLGTCLTSLRPTGFQFASKGLGAIGGRGLSRRNALWKKCDSCLKAWLRWQMTFEPDHGDPVTVCQIAQIALQCPSDSGSRRGMVLSGQVATTVRRGLIPLRMASPAISATQIGEGERKHFNSNSNKSTTEFHSFLTRHLLALIPGRVPALGRRSHLN